MNDFRLVMDYDIDLIRQFQGKAIVVRTNNPYQINEINDVVNEHNKLHCLILQDNSALSNIPVSETWENIPIHLFVPRFGNFMQFIEKRSIFDKLSIRVFLSSDLESNYKDLQILSSLHINCGLYFGSKTIPWDKLNDLMYYAIYGKVNHATIEPFDYVVKNYEYDKPTDFASVYLDNPHSYLHLNSEGKVAFSGNDFHNENFGLEHFSEIENISENQKYKDYLTHWNNFFMELNDCSCCPAWRICLGKFNQQIKENPGCAVFFNDLIEAAEFVKNNKNNFKQKELCQP